MKDFSELKAKIEELAKKAPAFVDDVLPHAVATVAANHFKENFQDEGFEGEKWQEVNRRKVFYTRNGKEINEKLIKGVIVIDYGGQIVYISL